MMNNGYLLLVSTIKWLHEAKSINNFPKDSTLKRLYIYYMWSKAGSLVTQLQSQKACAGIWRSVEWPTLFCTLMQRAVFFFLPILNRLSALLPLAQIIALILLTLAKCLF